MAGGAAFNAPVAVFAVLCGCGKEVHDAPDYYT